LLEGGDPTQPQFLVLEAATGDVDFTDGAFVN
jgi:hypothetical protein